MQRRSLEIVPSINVRHADLGEIGKDRDPNRISVGQILRVMKEASGENVSNIEGETEGFRAQMGFLLERALEKTFKEYVEVDDPLHQLLNIEDTDWQMALDHEGIVGHPDGYDKLNNRLISVKLTWKSARKWEESFDQHFRWWIMQEMSYAYMLSQQPQIQEPILDVLYVIGFMNGDYKGPWRLGVWTDLITFTPEELVDNWSVMQSYRRFLLEQKEEQ